MQLQNLTDASWSALLDRQRQRESAALADGERAFRAAIAREAQRGEFARTSVASILLKRGIEPMIKGLTALADKSAHTRGVRHVALKWIERVGAPVAAYITLKVVLDGITKRREYTTICCEVSDYIIDELRYRRLRDVAPGLFEYKLKQFRTSSYAHMARSMDHAVRTAHDDEGKMLDASDLEMTPHQRLNIGAKLVEVLVEKTGLVVPQQGERKRRDRKPKLYLEATEETNKWLTDQTDALARSFLQAQNLPMVAPPLQWAPGKRGGFRYALRGKYPLVRAIRSKEFGLTLERAELPLVYETINALQNTAWKINGAVLSLIAEIERRGGGMAGIPTTDPESEPRRPDDIDTNEVARKAWRKQAAAVKDQNHIRKLRAREVRRVLDTAMMVAEEESIFFPYSLDFRGRIYPIADYLHPQGNDLAKGLLTFAQGKLVDADGARWLAIHGANCLDEVPEGKMSKKTFDERVEWIHEHTAQIIQAAEEPFADLWWAAADAPMQFYAFCVEWRNLITANSKSESYICSLPVSMDGSCNGLQHFAAMLRDEIGGTAVNVVPQARPQDIYERVADSVIQKLEALAATRYSSDGERWIRKTVTVSRRVNGQREKHEREITILKPSAIAALLLGIHRKTGIVNRKLTKRPTMTFGYGSKRFGFKQQLKDHLRGLNNWHEVRAMLLVEMEEDGARVERLQIDAVCAMLATMIWDTLGEVVVKAAEGMEWMQECARGVVVTGNPVEWTVPVTGFRVRQQYIEWRSQRIKTILAGKMVQPRLNIATTKLDVRKQSNAIAPNVVHSLDAAALMLTVSQAAAQGVEAFAMVHDSYGTLPADCSVLASCCRQSFVRLYTMQDVVWSLYQQFAAQHADPTECPEPPAKGTLDVNAVLASDYFFA